MVGPEYGDQIKARLASADIFVLPSFLEGQPIAIIEAMASGLAVVGTSIGAVPDLIRDGVEGRVVEPGDAPALADALAQVIGDQDARRQMGHAARERAERSHGLEQLSARLNSLYRAVLSGRRSAAVERSVTVPQ
jgi:glycosyltransferase involved in cell wall biosynthesis